MVQVSSARDSWICAINSSSGGSVLVVAFGLCYWIVGCDLISNSSRSNRCDDRDLAQEQTERLACWDTQTYDAFGSLLSVSEDTLLLGYWEGRGHGDFRGGKIRLRRSTNGGESWTQIKTFGTSKDQEFFGTTGSRIYGGPFFLSVNIGQRLYTYRSEQGSTWSEPIPIYSGAGFASARGAVIEINKGVLMKPFYWRSKDDIGEAQEFRSMVAFSRDDGQTWEDPTTVLESMDRSNLYNEASYVYLGRGRIVGLVRDERKSRYHQVLSIDNGSTWEDAGMVPFSQGSFPHPPKLVRAENASGDTVVLCYYANRTNKQLLVIPASAKDLIREGAEAWNGSSEMQIASFTRERSGYPSIVHDNETCRSVVMAYDEERPADADILVYAVDLADMLGCRND
ncbi:sialidase family protein [Salinibacter ruber]|uniref:sialidase family protein n=1 Tax=Salinibacter ruber TaxID=146919 RepID=UPI0024522FF4|nr:hypothetical protein [Salinibacter ruber]